MDLRVKLVSVLGAWLFALLLATSLLLLYSLRDEVEQETLASAQLAQVIYQATRTAQQSPGSTPIAPEWSNPDQPVLRHVTVEVHRADQAPDPSPSPALAQTPGLSDWLSGWLARQRRETPIYTLRLGDDPAAPQLVIRPNPNTEIQEILQDARRILFILLTFSIATLCAAWYVAHRSLSPVRTLVENLSQLNDEQPAAPPPRFVLPEFNHIAAAVHQLHQRLYASRQRQHALAQQMLTLQEQERRELAQELHDEFGQSLTGIHLNAGFLQRRAEHSEIQECARDIADSARQILAQIRARLSALRPHGLENEGLGDALRELVLQTRQRGQVEVSLDLPDPLPPINERSGLVMYRVLQEALTNVLRHSQASACRISLQQQGSALALAIHDNGCATSQPATTMTGNGVLGMQERARMIGGQLHAGPLPQGGWQVHLSIPLNSAGVQPC